MYQLYQPATSAARRVDLRTVVQEVCQMLEGGVKQRDLIVRQVCPADLPMVYLPLGDVMQVLYNLVENAIQASPRQAELVISAAYTADAIRLGVTDRGVGIAPEIMPHIFEPFFTTKGGSTQEGIGLGLAVSYSLTTAMGGRLEVETEVGQGTTFTLVMPG